MQVSLYINARRIGVNKTAGFVLLTDGRERIETSLSTDLMQSRTYK